MGGFSHCCPCCADAAAGRADPRPRRVILLWLFATFLLFSCGSGGGDGPSGFGSNPGNPSNPGGPGGKGGTPLPYESRFSVTNHGDTARAEVVQVSIPFQEGEVTSLDSCSVEGHSTAWRILQRWPDGSVRVAQAQFHLELAPHESRTLEVVSGSPAWREPFSPNPWVASLWSGFSLRTEVKDIDGVPYSAHLGAGGKEVVVETALVRTTRFRTYHVNPDPQAGIQRDFLSLTAYVTEFRTLPVVVVDLVIGNDYLGADHPGSSTDPNLHPLGDLALKGAAVVTNAPVAFTYADKNGVGDPIDLGGGMFSHPLLHAGNRPGPNSDHYLADGQCKRWRLNVLFLHPQGTPAQQQAVKDTWAAMADEPLHPLATRKTWRGSRALGLAGVFVDPPTDGARRAESEYWGWRTKDHFGPFGSWGDTQYSGTCGTPRNGPLHPVSLHAVQTGYDRLLRKLEGMAWQQACRPYHLWGLKVEPTTDIILFTGLPYSAKGGWPPSNENLGRKQIYDTNRYAHYRAGVSYSFNGPYGWNGYDNEHFTTDLVFDYHTFTGDAWARDELAHLGECAMGVLRPSIYSTQWMQAVRCEGWMLASAVQVHLVTGDRRIKDHFLDRVRRIIDRDRRRNHLSKALGFQSDYPGTTYPMPHKFYMPWQHGAALHGLVAAARFFQDRTAGIIAEECLTAVEYAWVKDYNDPHYGFLENGLRYYVPVEYQGKPVGADYFDNWPGCGVRWGDSPLGGAHGFLITGLLYLSDYTQDRGISDKAAEYARILLKARMYDQEWRWDKWSATVPSYHVP